MDWRTIRRIFTGRSHHYPKSFDNFSNTPVSPTYILKYIDSNGETTERIITKTKQHDDSNINAYCITRQEQRTFKLDRILELSNSETGIYCNPYIEFGMSNNKDGTEKLESALWPLIIAARALKFFALTISKFRTKDRIKLLKFIKEYIPPGKFDDSVIEQWIYKLWCGDIYKYYNGNIIEYENLLKHIPNKFIERCFDYAIFIAGGTGRKSIDPNIIRRIELEFQDTPIVIPPQQKIRNDETICARIGFDIDSYLKK